MTILVETHAHYRLITLTRPERLNALTVEMAEALSAAFDAAAADESCRALLITGAGRAFCAGQDLTAIVGLALAEPLPAATAAEWGMIWRVVADDRLMAEAHALAARLAGGATRALALTKRALDAAETRSEEHTSELQSRV